MSDHIYVEKDSLPWRPSAASELVEVLHRFTIPLVGVIRQHNATFVFWCVVGHAGPDSAWAYAQVDNPDDLGDVRSATNETFDGALRRLVDGRASAFAIASEDRGIIEWVTIEPPAGFDSVHARGMEELGLKINEAMAEMDTLMDQFPSLRAASSFSIAPSPRN